MSKIGIICACEIELAPFLPHLEQSAITEKAMLQLHEGTIGGIPVVLLYCGVCKVNAALAVQLLIDTCHVDAILNAGVAGGMDPAVQLFDTVIATHAAYHDVDAEIFTAYHPGLESIYFKADQALLSAAQTVCAGRKTVHFGTVVTGEQFIADNLRDAINAAFSPLSVDMETAAMAHVCHVNRTPFLCVRSISDTADHSGIATFEANCAKAAIATKDIVVALLPHLSRVLNA